MMEPRKSIRFVPALLCAVAALLALNLFRTAEPRADAQPQRFNTYMSLTADGGALILYRMTSTGEVEAYDSSQLAGLSPRWAGWRRLP